MFMFIIEFKSFIFHSNTEIDVLIAPNFQNIIEICYDKSKLNKINYQNKINNYIHFFWYLVKQKWEFTIMFILMFSRVN